MRVMGKDFRCVVVCLDFHEKLPVQNAKTQEGMAREGKGWGKVRGMAQATGSKNAAPTRHRW